MATEAEKIAAAYNSVFSPAASRARMGIAGSCGTCGQDDVELVFKRVDGVLQTDRPRVLANHYQPQDGRISPAWCRGSYQPPKED